MYPKQAAAYRSLCLRNSEQARSFVSIGCRGHHRGDLLDTPIGNHVNIGCQTGRHGVFHDGVHGDFFNGSVRPHFGVIERAAPVTGLFV